MRVTAVDRSTRTSQPDSTEFGRGAFLARLMGVIIFMAGFALFSVGAGQSGGGSILRQFVWISLCMIAIAASVREEYWTSGPKLPRWSGIVLVMPLAYATASYFWSYEPGTTIRRAALFAVLLIMCYTVFVRGSGARRDFLAIIAWPVGALLALSIIVTALLPGYSITEYGWRGITSHKNELGQISALGVLVGIAGILGRRYFLAWCGVGVSIALLVLSRSATSAISLGVAVTALAGMTILRRSSRSRALQIFLLSLGIFVLLTIFSLFVLDLLPSVRRMADTAFSITGKSTTLTGRTDLWELVLLNAKQNNPWIGGGYGAFWTGPNGAAGYISWRFPGGYVGSAHNGYLDIFNELGYGGLGLLLLFLGFHINLLRRATWLNGPEWFFHGALLIFVTIVNTAESSFWRGTSFLNLIFLASYCRLLVNHAKYVPVNRRQNDNTAAPPAGMREAGLADKNICLDMATE